MRVPLNPENERDGHFDFYYFIYKSGRDGPGRKTVLFCSGGPGQLVRPGDENFLQFLVDKNTAYQVVYFHLRGSGFSQLPPSNRFDKFLRTPYAVEDIERIRIEVLGDQPWDGIVGYSYGTVLAQQYAAAKKYEKKVRKLILIGPQSMHKFKQSCTAPQAFKEYIDEVQDIRHKVVAEILARNDEFEGKRLTDDDVNKITRKLDATYDRIEATFGNEKFIADHYDSLACTPEWKHSGLKGLDRNFFQKLRELRQFGWNPISTDRVKSRQAETIKVIAVSLIPGLALKLGELEPRAPSSDDPAVYGAYRTFYVVRINDGLDRRYLKELVGSEKRDLRGALDRSPGTSRVNQYYRKIGIVGQRPAIWDPADHKHGVDTLILKGKADPVSADGQAKHYFSEALTGKRALFEFEGVGHQFDFPYITIRTPFMIGSTRIDPGKIDAKKTTTVKGAIPRLARIVEVDDQNKIRLAREAGRRKRRKKILTFGDVNIESNDKISAQVTSSSSDAEGMEGVRLSIRHLMFRGTVTLDGLEIPPGVESWVSGTLKIEEEYFSLEPPANLEKELEFVPDSVELDLPDFLSFKIKNTADHAVVGAPRNWIYRPLSKNKKFEGPCQGRDRYSRDCIIYPFLEMEYDSYREEIPKILRRIKRRNSFPGAIDVRYSEKKS
jgi:pimeloyl-ACP methyl ester carboxylesterase